MTISPATLDRLRQFDTPTVCNVIELFDVRPRTEGFMNASIQAAFPEMPPMVGFASTASFRSSAFPGKGDAYGSMEQQVETFAQLGGPAVVVLTRNSGPTGMGALGVTRDSSGRRRRQARGEANDCVRRRGLRLRDFRKVGRRMTG